jgi:hypothetical protein
MRRALLICLVGSFLAVLGAGPALAQRDPFDPATGGQSAEEEPSGSAEEGPFNQGESAGQAEEPVTPPQVNENGSEVLANTGADVSPWLVLAYGLIVAGAAAVVVARTWRAQTPRR